MVFQVAMVYQLIPVLQNLNLVHTLKRPIKAFFGKNFLGKPKLAHVINGSDLKFNFLTCPRDFKLGTKLEKMTCVTNLKHMSNLKNVS